MQITAEYTDRLTKLSQDNSGFDRVIGQLSADRFVSRDGMRTIARLYLGYELAKKKGRAAALSEIVKRQTVMARQDARCVALDRLGAW